MNTKIASRTATFVLAGLAALTASLPVSAQDLARPRSTVDLSRTDRLIGAPAITETTPGYCPSGQVFSGGTCVMIPNQTPPYSPAWTRYFIGQSRSSGGVVASIQSDGTVRFVFSRLSSYFADSVAAPPAGNGTTVAFSVGQCEAIYGYANPVFSNEALMSGQPPHDWSVSYQLSSCVVQY